MLSESRTVRRENDQATTTDRRELLPDDKAIVHSAHSLCLHCLSAFVSPGLLFDRGILATSLTHNPIAQAL